MSTKQNNKDYYDDEKTDELENGQPNSWSPLLETHQEVVDDTTFLDFYRRAADLKRKYDISLSIPEFILVGVQSSGKSSCLSQFLQMSVGFIQSGTGTRQPVRYSVVYSEETEPPRVWVDDNACEKVEDLPSILQQRMKALQDRDEFSDEIIQVQIETNRAPDMVIIDLPGLIISNSSEPQMDSVRDLVGKFITDKNPSGEFNYIPLIILKAQDPQTDPTFPALDELCEDERKNWKRDSVFVVNQIDLFNHNFKDANHLVEYFDLIKGFVDDGCIVVCSMNPQGKVLTSNVDFKTEKEVHDYLHDVPELEIPVLTNMFQKYGQNATAEVRRTLTKYRNEHCGIPVMRHIVQKKIKNIVQRIKPFIQQALEDAHVDWEERLNKARLQETIADPLQLMRRVTGFEERIFLIKKEFEDRNPLKCRQRSQLNCCSSWQEEMDKFRQSPLSLQAREWDKVYYLEPRKLEEILKKHPNRDHYISKMRHRLRGRPQYERFFSIWCVMFSLMDFPREFKTEKFIQQVSVTFDGQLNINFWKTVRNVLDRATRPLERACEWVGDYYRWRFKTDFKEVIHHVCNTDKCADFRIFSSDNFSPCIELIESGYNNCIETLVQDFIDSAKYNRNDSIRLIDEHQIATFIQTARNLDQEKNDNKLFVSMTPLEQVNISPLLDNFPEKVVKTSELYFRVIRYLLLEETKGKLLHRLLYYVMNDYTKLRNACITGILDTPTKDHVDILASFYRIDPERLTEILERESKFNISQGHMINQDELMEKCGFNQEKLKSDVVKAEKDLDSFLEEQAKINELLRNMDNAAHALDRDY